MWSIEKLPLNNPLSFYWLQTSIKLLQNLTLYSPNSHFLKSLRSFTKYSTKNTYKTFYTYNSFKTPINLHKIILGKVLPKHLFNVYSSLLTQSSTLNTRIHPSQKFFFLIEVRSNTRAYNLTKILTKWLDIYNLLLNLFYYQIPILIFGTPTFRRELVSLNWLLHTKIQDFWKYVPNSFFTSRNKVVKQEFLLFNYLNKKGYYMGFVFDILYHQNTVFLLKRNNFFTIGLTPVSMNLYTVDFALPITNDSVFMHLFFVRFIIYIKKISTSIHWENKKNMWKLFVNL